MEESAQDRARRWNRWRDDVYVEYRKLVGDESGSESGAMRWIGDFVVAIDAEPDGVARLWVTLNSRFPQMMTAPTSFVKWEQTTPSRAAAFIAELCEKLKSNPGYIWTKRSESGPR